jgi:hypothetical protein
MLQKRGISKRNTMAEEKVEELSLSSIMPNDQRMVSKWKKHEEYSKKISRENLREEPRYPTYDQLITTTN